MRKLRESKMEEPQSLKNEKAGEKEEKISKRAKCLAKTARGIVYLLIFLLPLFFLPWTSNVLDFNKQALILFLSFLAFICWLAGVLISNKLEINSSFLNVPVIIFLLISSLSVIFSIFRYGSFWGWPLTISSSLLSLLGFTVFYFLTTNLFKRKDVPSLLFTFSLSGFLVSLLLILQLSGRFILPFNFAKTFSFNTIGTLNDLAIYLSLSSVLIITLFFLARKWIKIIFGIFGMVLIFTLFLINFKTAWLVFSIGMGAFFVFGATNLRKIEGFSFTSLLIILLVIGLSLTFFKFSLAGIPAAPSHFPTQKLEIETLKQVPLKSLFLGTGPGTFIYVWSKYKPAEVNQTIFWADKFEVGASEILDRIITTGILGILALVFLLFFSLKLIFRLLFSKTAESEISDWLLTLGISAGFISLVSAFFFYPANFSIFLIFWLLIGSSALLEKEERKVWVLSVSPVKTLSFSLFFILVLVFGIWLLSSFGQKYLAEVKYFQGLGALQKGDSAVSTNDILEAINLNPRMDIYWRDLSQIYLIRLNEILAKPDLSSEERTSQIQPLIANAVNSASRATDLNPENVANWNIRGFEYRSFIGIWDEMKDWAMKSYSEASRLEPTNPYIFTEIGLVYLAKADIFEQQDKESDRVESLKLAQESFGKAISLKSDYAPAHFQIAMIYVREGKVGEAIERLETIKQVAPFDTGLALQLGIIYYNDNQLDRAQAELERAISLDRNYSNARYFLGLIYDRKDDKKRAIEQFEEIGRLNPENEETKKILSNLREGKSALEGMTSIQAPIGEKPPERLEK